MRCANMMMCMPMRPMSWVSGIHDRRDVVLVEARGFAWRRAHSRGCCACVSTTPLGSLVEPGGELDERGVVRLRARARSPAREMSSSVVDQERARARALSNVSGFAGLGRRTRRCARASLLVGVDEGLAELARDAQQLVPVLVADAERHRHRHDAAEQRGPERVDELLVVGEEQDQLVAAASRRASAGETGCRARARSSSP